MRVIFMGTPDFARPTLQELISAGHDVIAVVTQPDKPKGRGKAMQLTPVKEEALKHNIPVYQPKRVREEDFVGKLRTMAPDVIVVVAFGQILPKSILDIPKYGCVNVHASLLPKYRGAAPIQWAVINGEQVSGVTTMYMAEGLDTGDMLLKKEVVLDKDETGGSLHDKLSIIGGKLLVKTLEGIENGTIVPEKQDDSQAGEYAVMLDKSIGSIDFNKPAQAIERLIRGLSPWPSAYTHIDNKILKIWAAELSDVSEGEIGSVTAIDRNSFTVRCGVGSIRITEVQLEGKKRMDAGSFLRGYDLSIGCSFE